MNKKLFLRDEAPKTKQSVSFNDLLEIPSQRSFTDSGQLIVPCAFARTGVYQYTADCLGMDGDPTRLVDVYRTEEEVFNEDSMASFRSAPVTLGHPPVSVTAKNSKEYQKGFLEGMPTRDEDCLKGTLVVSDQEAIDAIQEGKQELSAGYVCDLFFGDDGKVYQKNIRANHIAIVDKGRAGSLCKIADSEETISLSEHNKKLLDISEENKKAVSKSEALIDSLKEEIKELKDSLESSKNKITTYVDVVVKGMDISDAKFELTDTLSSFKRKVLTSLYPDLDLKDKDSSYIDARFDLALELGDKETPMTRVLRDNSACVLKPREDVVSKAREKMINRNSKKEN